MNDGQERQGTPVGWYGLGVFLGLGVMGLILGWSQLRALAVTLADAKPGVWGRPTFYGVVGAVYALGLGGLLLSALVGASTPRAARRGALLLLLFAGVRGILWSALAPPWQAPDEHAHVEYAALMGELGRVPTLADVSPAMQQRITRSMFRHDFWRRIRRPPVAEPPIGFVPQSGITDVPPTNVVDGRFLYYPQMKNDPPLYYVAPALVYALLPRADVTLQLYAMRLATVVLFVGFQAAVLWATRRLFPRRPALVLSVATLLVMLPMLTHIGSVVHNEIAAALVGVLLLGTLIGVLRQGLRRRAALAVLALVLVGWGVKKSTLWAIPLVVGMGLLAVARRYRWVRRALLALGVVGAVATLVLFALPSQLAPYWTPRGYRGGVVTCEVAAAGECALRVAGGATAAGVLEQRLLTQAVIDLRGRDVVFEAQVRGAAPGQAGALAVLDAAGVVMAREDFVAGTDWTPIALPLSVPEDAGRLIVRLSAGPQATIYADQLTLPGVQNGSGERVYAMGEALLVILGRPLGADTVARRFLDRWRGNLRALLENPRPLRMTFQSFWGNFGAALVVPLPPMAYGALRVLCGMGVVGLGLCIYRCLRGPGKLQSRLVGPTPWQRQALWMLGAASALAIAQVVLPWLAMYGLWALQGRYLFSVVWPLGLLLVLGLAQWFPSRHRRWLWPALTLFLIGLDVVALRTLVHAFYP
jgi:hypothetical protein